ncbi:hypothetical protein [Nocardia cyriacigeorgica]|uniref:hypothetical protein n=1 Tax=Nocardia cyriacigeorgica TaxID=135487 RepID=UPI001892F220|nr:hypothetical protein [Nocardia cyriacigeorgica]MBF6455152.1 hypothetical protein [Nocardia cyriacigeorgica]MBF6479973.1 hypothetical protein [Nocardia cyriacigeorgica]MBF6554106.1 hypothetical protein [Nocardia cyriacigeorgica]
MDVNPTLDHSSPDHHVRAAVDRYRRDFGLPAEFIDGRAVLHTTQALAALQIPPRLAWSVRQALHAEPSVPVIGQSTSKAHWVFLVSPDRRVGPRTLDAVGRRGVATMPTGSRIALPVPGLEFGPYWVCAPTFGPLALPLRSTVLAATRAVLEWWSQTSPCG